MALTVRSTSTWPHCKGGTMQSTMVHQQPEPLLPKRRQRMGVSITGNVFSNFEDAQAHADREAREHRARVAERYQQLLAGGAA